jgi:hypothetical protein
MLLPKPLSLRALVTASTERLHAIANWALTFRRPERLISVLLAGNCQQYFTSPGSAQKAHPGLFLAGSHP